MRNPDETILEYMARITSWLRESANGLTERLPSIEAAEELFSLISDVYDVSTLEEAWDIAAEDNNWEPLIEFNTKYHMGWEDYSSFNKPNVTLEDFL